MATVVLKRGIHVRNVRRTSLGSVMGLTAGVEGLTANGMPPMRNVVQKVILSKYKMLNEYYIGCFVTITLILFVIPYYLFLSILDDVEDKKPVDGMWTTWSSWKECTKTCGIGERTRLRDCRNPPPKNSGAYCVGPMSETEYCQSASCPDPSVSIVPPPRPGKKVDDIRGFRFIVF